MAGKWRRGIVPALFLVILILFTVKINQTEKIPLVETAGYSFEKGVVKIFAIACLSIVVSSFKLNQPQPPQELQSPEHPPCSGLSMVSGSSPVADIWMI